MLFIKLMFLYLLTPTNYLLNYSNKVFPTNVVLILFYIIFSTKSLYNKLDKSARKKYLISIITIWHVLHIRAFYTNYSHHISNNFKNIISVSFNLYKYDITDNIRHGGTRARRLIHRQVLTHYCCFLVYLFIVLFNKTMCIVLSPK